MNPKKSGGISQETHFVELPSPEKLQRIEPIANQHVPDLESYRTKDAGSLNMTLQVVSCSPRVFEIQHFLSRVEIDHLMKIATGTALHHSSTRAGDQGTARQDSTRTSRNAWIE
jgi:hypothetical protein